MRPGGGRGGRGGAATEEEQHAEAARRQQRAHRGTWPTKAEESQVQASGQGCDSRRLRGGGCTPDMGMNRAGCGCTFHPPSLPFPRAPTREADHTPGASARASAAAAVARPCGRAPSLMQPLVRPSAGASRPNSTAGPRRAGRPMAARSMAATEAARPLSEVQSRAPTSAAHCRRPRVAAAHAASAPWQASQPAFSAPSAPRPMAQASANAAGEAAAEAPRTAKRQEDGTWVRDTRR